MSDEIRFTSQLTFEVLAAFGEHTMFRLQLPVFAWLAHGDFGLNPLIEPVFYVDDTPDVSSVLQMHLLRGATEAACEEAWEIYSDLVRSGLPAQTVRHVLPVSLMVWGTVTFTEAQIKDFVAKHRGSPMKELALVAHGYERALTDG